MGNSKGNERVGQMSVRLKSTGYAANEGDALSATLWAAKVYKRPLLTYLPPRLLERLVFAVFCGALASA